MTSSITDKPITARENDLLNIGEYADALSDFIKESDTPLTIGMQGEWGSGKTSLMYMVKENLDKVAHVDGKQDKIATAWLTTWEYSLFRDPAETTPAILSAMLENLKRSLEEGKYSLPGDIKGRFNAVNNGLKFLGKTTLDAVLEKILGGIATKDIHEFIEAYKKLKTETPLTEVAEVKLNIQTIVNQLIKDDNNPFKKVVFFIDDLDRLEPTVAVEILEALKNLFDVEHCIFVLAIDYDVVIKGLEKKFGKKAEKNEREFRSFFDKIIQLPFSMPVNAYQIEKLLERHFERLNFTPDPKFKDGFEDVVLYTVGNNPRSIKRYVNTFSLLKKLIESKQTQGVNVNNAEEVFCLFTLVGIQIAFPTFYQLFMKNLEFLKWGDSFAELNNIKIEVPQNLQNKRMLDEKWEQIIWSFCGKNIYLKIRAFDIIKTLDTLRVKIGEEKVNQTIQSVFSISNLTTREGESLLPITESKALDQILDVANLMIYEKKSFIESVKYVKDQRKISGTMVRDNCTKELGLNTENFMNLTGNKIELVEFLINRFPDSKGIIQERLRH